MSAHPRVVAIAVNPEVDALTIARRGARPDGPPARAPRVDRPLGPVRDRRAHRGARRCVARTKPRRRRPSSASASRCPASCAPSDGLVRDAPHLRLDRRRAARARRGRDRPARPSSATTRAMGAPSRSICSAPPAASTTSSTSTAARAASAADSSCTGCRSPARPGYAGEFGQNRPGIASAADRRAGDGVLEDEVSRARLLAALGRGNADDPDPGAAAARVARHRRAR